jgi:ADP-sugar diphosphatase
MSRPQKTTFKLTEVSPDIEVSLPWNLTEAQLLAFVPFNNWLESLKKSLSEQYSDPEHPFRKDPYSLRFIDIHAANWFETKSGPKLGFLTMEAGVRNNNNKDNSLPGVIFLRGGSVAMLMIIKSDTKSDDRWVIMTQQPRIPAGSLNFFEIPAGMIDEEEVFAGAAAREIEEETGIKVSKRSLTDMTALALESASSSESHMQKAMYPSPGGCDEFIPLFLYQATMSETRINGMKGNLRGVRGEKITVKLVKYEELWREGARDAKTLAAWALYEGLIREGKIKRR